MIKNIVFDMGNVLLGWTPMAFARRCAANEEEAGILYEALFGGEAWGRADGGLLTQEELLRIALEKTPLALHPAMQELMNSWPHWMEPIVGADRFVRRVKAAGLGVYLLSNAGPQFPEVLQDRPFYGLLDGAVVSAHERLTKPDARLYEVLLKRYSLKAQECFFIDDIAVNVQGALSVGMQGLVFEGDYQKVEEALLALGLKL